LIESLAAERSLSRAQLNSLAMDKVAADPDLQAALFRLVDVTPMCRNLDAVSDHLEALLGEVENPGLAVRSMRGIARRPALSKSTGLLARTGVRQMAARFIAGADPASALPEIRKLWQRNVAATIDLLGEATVAEAEADIYVDRCENTLRVLSEQAGSWPDRPHLEQDRHGYLPRVNLSVKLSAMTPDSRAESPQRGADGARERFRRLLRTARDLEAHLHIDMESLDFRETVTQLVFETLSEPEFKEGPSVGMVLQGYLTDSQEELERWIEWQAGSERSTPLTIRLVKGAYWDHEVAEAAQLGWPVPVFTERSACDRNFEALTLRLLRSTDLVRPVIASHNLRSIAHAIAAAEAFHGTHSVVEFQVLRGLGDDIQNALAENGFRVRTYSPIGDLISGMAYLVRRLLENTSNDSFLRARAESDNLESLLVAP
jgi:RHH-type proline utilization regulon transcriptional repressor/proline dehydrogenase/delta 1-pyrroline-5-carboxylate dehydrogenase